MEKKKNEFKPTKVVLSGKAYERIKARLKRKRREFMKLSISRQRVAIARDVIAQIKARKIIAASVYMDFATDLSVESRIRSQRSASKEVGAITSQVKCYACGIGSMFIAAVEFADELKMSALSGGDRYSGSQRETETRYLRTWFDASQMDLVEQYYERRTKYALGDSGPWGQGYRTAPPVERASSPILLEDDNSKRLIMIMENIISNRGRFVPTTGKHKHF